MVKQKKDKYLDANRVAPEETPEVKPGPPWTKVAVYQTYEEADKKRNELGLLEPTFNVKVKRCGNDGLQFMVKKRVDPKLAKISKEIDETMKKSRAQKSKTNKKKTSKRIKKTD